MAKIILLTVLFAVGVLSVQGLYIPTIARDAIRNPLPILRYLRTIPSINQLFGLSPEVSRVAVPLANPLQGGIGLVRGNLIQSGIGGNILQRNIGGNVVGLNPLQNVIGGYRGNVVGVSPLIGGGIGSNVLGVTGSYPLQSGIGGNLLQRDIGGNILGVTGSYPLQSGIGVTGTNGLGAIIQNGIRTVGTNLIQNVIRNI